MNILGNSIKELRKNKGLTQKDLANLTGFKQNTISNHENGKRQLDETDIHTYARALNVEPQLLFDLSKGYSTPTLSAITETASKLEEPRQVKVLTYAKSELEEQERASNDVREELYPYRVAYDLSAGLGKAFYENQDYDTVYYEEEIPYDAASWISGDSMEPKYLDGSVALIADTSFDYDGAVYAVQWDGNLYIKKVYKEKDGLRLVSINKKYADKFAAYEEEPRIIGKVVGNFVPMEG